METNIHNIKSIHIEKAHKLGSGCFARNMVIKTKDGGPRLIIVMYSDIEGHLEIKPTDNYVNVL